MKSILILLAVFSALTAFAQRDYTYEIGDQWIYEQEEYIGPNNTQVQHTTFTIEDAVSDGDYTKYALGALDTFYVDGSKMYFWDDYYEEYIMYYDWMANANYDIKYYDPFNESEEVATVVIDSVTYKHFVNDSLKVQHVRIQNSGTVEGDFHYRAYEGVGASHTDIQFSLGCGLCDPQVATTKLRCLINDTMTYRFVPYPCDSTWIQTATLETEKSDINIYPNPTNGEIYIEGINGEVEYELHAGDGRLLEKSTTSENPLFIPQPGMYLLRIKSGNYYIQKKVLRVE